MSHSTEFSQLLWKWSSGVKGKCPPIVYIGLDESDMEVISKIKEADVLEPGKVFIPKFGDGFCSRCMIKMLMYKDDKNQGVPLAFQHKAVNQFLLKNLNIIQNLSPDPYNGSNKLLAGLAHIATLGSALIAEKMKNDYKTWPDASLTPMKNDIYC